MSKSAKYSVLALSLLIVLFTIAGGFGVHASTNADGAFTQIKVFGEVIFHINQYYVEQPKMPVVTDGALHGLLESLDPNSAYLNPAEYKVFKARKADGEANIGATVSKRFGYAAVVSVLPGTPAAKAGIEPGDILESINDKTTTSQPLAQIRSALAGEPGSQVNITIIRPRKAEPFKVSVTRAAISVAPPSSKMLEAGIGYIKVDALTKGKSQEIAGRIKDLEKQGAKKLVLDLRNVAEGPQEEGVATANLFLDHGTITYLEGQKYPRVTYNAEPGKAATKLPLAVLVNRSTSGAAEIVAAAVMENARGDVVGAKTYGEGSVQKLIEVPDGSALILSVAKFYTPGGKPIQETAVTPNVPVADTQDDFTGPDDEDNQQPNPQPQAKPQSDDTLKKAIEVLKMREQKTS
jgi:carboxyl-terminal processing protease